MEKKSDKDQPDYAYFYNYSSQEIDDDWDTTM